MHCALLAPQNQTVTGLPEGVYRVRYEIVDEAGNKRIITTVIVGMANEDSTLGC
jgi:hypothetical protein